MLWEEAKYPFILDSREPKGSIRDFLESEIRFTQLQNTFPELAEELYAKAEKDARERYEIYKRMAEMDFS